MAQKMVKKRLRSPVILVLFLSLYHVAKAQDFPLATTQQVASVLYSKEGPPLDSIAARLLAEDIERVTGHQPKVITDAANAAGNVIVIGNVASGLVQTFIGQPSSLNKSLQGKWECFALKVMDKPTANVSKALVIAGSDARGTAYGVFTVSEKIGVSPWWWWADVPVKRQSQVILHQPEFVSAPPSVNYRGIFINDEDWGLRPWSARTFEPDLKNIGPKTYAKVFELLLRLKANLIWPAMHSGTTAFYAVPGNKEVAAQYSIVIGSSHAEPMLRNNVGEWDEKTMGHFNYLTNKEKIVQYWEDRVKETSGNEVIYTMGMRGVHDSQMEGVKSAKEAVPLLEQILADQRSLFKKHQQKDVTAIPQVFTPYKEVLEFYDSGLTVPDDVTLVWPDDNYGYIERLSNEKEKQRSGGSGVYYHISYWGRPHDYLWLSTVHPSLIREEMMKAYDNGADRLWVVNVGDIKPMEYDTQLFLDMAYDAKPFRDDRYVKTHLIHWVNNIFGEENGPRIGAVLWQYYRLAFERKPEFMGWSQTEPTTKTAYTAFNHFYYGDEAQKRMDAYDSLEKEVKALRSKMDPTRSDAFYELVYYPVAAASWINKKFLYRDKAAFYAGQNRLSAMDYAALSRAAYDSIVKETEYYNTQLAGGKWQAMMSMKPRELPVFGAPVLPEIALNNAEGWSLAPEGFISKDSSLFGEAGTMRLPSFDDVHKQRYFLDVFLTNNGAVSWTADASAPWIKLSQDKGTLLPEAGKNQVRIWISVDWNKVPAEATFKGQLIFKGGDKQLIVTVEGHKRNSPALAAYKGFIENNGAVCIHAAGFSRQAGKQYGQWQVLEDLGYTGRGLQALPSSTGGRPVVDTAAIKNRSAVVEYDFYTFTAAPAQATVFTLPTRPLNNHYGMRYAVAIDDGPLKIVDFKTVGRSEEWKQNVLSNRAGRSVRLPFLESGKHTLKIHAIDPGVTLDEIRIDLGGLKKAYSVLPETKQRQ